MSDRVREAFMALIEEMEDPPTWQDIRVYEARPRPELRRPRSVWVAAAAFIVVLAFGAIGFLLSSTEPASVTVPYVQLDWSNQVQMRCEGMEIVDNGGSRTQPSKSGVPLPTMWSESTPQLWTERSKP